jgi:hypothetical protein
MKWRCFVPVYLLLLTACKSKEDEAAGDSGYFPVVSYLQSQVRHVDTSLYTIVKIRKAPGVQDTTYLRREDFRAAAQDFLALPEITTKALQKKYAETKLYDQDLKKVIISYLPKDRADYQTVTREDVIIEPNSGGGDQVQSIYIETLSNSSDSTIAKKMTWNVNRNFQVIKLITRKGQPEIVETTSVTWSGGR